MDINTSIANATQYTPKPPTPENVLTNIAQQKQAINPVSKNAVEQTPKTEQVKLRSAQSVPAQKEQAPKEDKPVETESSKQLNVAGYSVRFSVESDQPIVTQIVDPTTGEVVKEIPPEVQQKISSALKAEFKKSQEANENNKAIIEYKDIQKGTENTPPGSVSVVV